MTKNWSRGALDIGVACEENVDRVIDVRRDIGRELRDAGQAPLPCPPPHAGAASALPGTDRPDC